MRAGLSSSRRPSPPAAQPAPARSGPAAAATREVSPQTASRIASFRGGGEALSPAARAYFEPRFGRTERCIQRSPLSDSVRAAFTADPTPEALLARLSQSDVQGAQNDADVDAEIARLLAGRADDLWVAQRVRQGMLGRTTGAFGPRVRGRPVPRPIQAFFFRGATTRRALVIAGVHGTERQGIEVARMLIADLQTQQPHFTVIVVPSLFPDNAAFGRFGRRESGRTPTNRNFPPASEDLAAAQAAGGGTAVDASTDRRGRRRRAILPENLLLMELIERFQPERIISIHGTRRAGAGGVFYDPRDLRSDEVRAARQAARAWAADEWANTPGLPEWERDRALEQRLFFMGLAGMRQQASDVDRALSLRAATQIDTATTSITGRERRPMRNRENDPARAPSAEELEARREHPSVAGNVGPSGALDLPFWSGSGPGRGVSLGEYASARGMSVFTVEPPINRATGDYPTRLDTIDAAQRRIELQSYADAVRTVLLGAP